MTRARNRLLRIGGLVATAAGLAGAGASAQDASAGFTTYENDKHGFSLIYSTNQFLALPTATPDGFQAVSKDGKARLLAGTIANFDGKSLGRYRAFLLNEIYPGARVDYAPVRDTWFVLSGVKADATTAFYQRVNFVCAGRNINSWAVVFPAGDEPTYSKIIEQVHRDYVIGDGNCARATMLESTKQPKQTGAMDPTMSKQMAAMEPVMPPKQMAAMEQPATPNQMAAMDQPAMPKQTGTMGMESANATYSNDKHGFSLAYPASQFLALPPATPDAFQAVSRDGKARLLAGTIANFDGKTLGAYRSFLLAETYPNAKLDDEPARDNGFVLSGVKSDGTTAFYQRINFVCGGRNINSWAVVFPYDEEYVYSNIIEQLHKDYRLGDGNCDTTTMMRPTSAR